MTDAPKIQFPCDDYIIKVVGVASPQLKPFVTSVLTQIDSAVTQQSYRETLSKNGRFLSLTVKMRIVRKSQLTELFDQLKVNSLIKLVL